METNDGYGPIPPLDLNAIADGALWLLGDRNPAVSCPWMAQEEPDAPFDPDCCGDPASCYAACRNSDGTPWSPACS